MTDMAEHDGVGRTKTELLPCPFCGGEAVLHEMRYGEGKQHSVFGVFCATDAGAEYQHGHFIDNFATEAEAVEAWNKRAERTCHMEGSGFHPPTCSACGFKASVYDCACFEGLSYRYDGNFCRNCGAKVVSE